MGRPLPVNRPQLITNWCSKCSGTCVITRHRVSLFHRCAKSIKFSVFLITNKNSINPPQTQNPGNNSGAFAPFFQKKAPLPRGGGFRNALVCKDFNFCCSFYEKQDKQLD